MKKIIASLFAFLLSLSMVSALDLGIESITVNDKFDLNLGGATDAVLLERGEDLEIEVCYNAATRVNDVEFMTFISGYEYAELSDTVGPVNILPGRKCRTMEFGVPADMDKGNYAVRLFMATATDEETLYNFPIVVAGSDDNVIFDDVTISPSKKIQAGDAIYASYRLKNLGNEDESDIKVEFSIPELGLLKAVYLDFEDKDFEAEDSKVGDEIYLRVPSDVEAGNYDVELRVTYNRGRDYDVWTEELEVYANEMVQSSVSKATVSLATDYQSVYVGEEASFPIIIKNDGDKTETFEVMVTPIGDWGNVEVVPGHMVVLNSGEYSTVYVLANVEESGKHNMLVKISNDDLNKEVTLSVEGKQKVVVDDSDADWDSVKKGVEIGLIVLIALLVILALVIAFSKGRGKNTDEEGKPETYY